MQALLFRDSTLMKNSSSAKKRKGSASFSSDLPTDAAAFPMQKLALPLFFLAEGGLDFPQGEAVDDVGFFQPAFAGERDSEPD